MNKEYEGMPMSHNMGAFAAQSDVKPTEYDNTQPQVVDDAYIMLMEILDVD